MKMTLVGMSNINEGVSKKKNEPYMMIDVHFIGRSIRVKGNTVAKVGINLLEVENLPQLEIGGVYNVDLSDKGYLNDIELLELPAAKADEPGSEAEPNQEEG